MDEQATAARRDCPKVSFRGQKDKERQKVSFVSQSVCAYIATVDQRGASLAGSTWRMLTVVGMGYGMRCRVVEHRTW